MELVFVVAPITIIANILISITTIIVIRIWLEKIYRGIRQIVIILEYFYRKEKEEK